MPDSAIFSMDASLNSPSIVERPRDFSCPRCGSRRCSSMATLRDLVSKPSSEFSPDLAEWLTPPSDPRRPVSRRHRIGIRNSVAFGAVFIVVVAVACYALFGALPTLPAFILAFAAAILIGVRSWRAEFLLASKEDRMLLEAHRERQNAYARRSKVWARLRYCSNCAMVIDPATMQATSIYEVHELANSREER